MTEPVETLGKSPPSDFVPDRFLNSLFLVSKSVLLSPNFFYEGMKREGGLRNPFIYLATCVFTHTLLVGLLIKSQSLIAMNLVFGMVFPFLTAGILFFLITRLFKSPGTYELAFRVNAYAAAVALFSWMPLIGMILEFYRLYLIGVGLRHAFSIKTSRALLAIVLTIAIYMAASFAIHYLTGGQWPKPVS